MAAGDLFAAGGDMAARMRAYDWSRTPLGPPAEWPQSLKIAVRIMLASRYAMWMAWGSELTFFCNDAYLPTLGVKESWALGSRAREVWAEIWKDIGPRIESVLETGQATYDEGLLLFLERSGYAEETYHTFSYSPVPDDAGGIAGMLCVVTEESERVIGQRRLASLREIASELASTNTEEEVATALCRSLGANPRDLPFTAIYLLDGSAGQARLLCGTGLVEGDPAAPALIEVGVAEAVWPVTELLAGIGPLVVDRLEARFATLPTGAWDKPPSQAILVPIAQQGHERPAGFLVTGINPYRPLDAGYGGFLDLVAGQIASGLANARAYEAERRRAEALAALDRAKTAFFANVSHEFRTPLTLMLGPLEELLARPDLPPEARTSLDLTHRNSLRLLRLVNTLLDFSRIEAGRTQAAFEPTDLATLTAELASSFRSACERAGLVLEVDCPPLPEPVHVDRDMWEKIVLNLLSNAFKFTFEGGIELSLRKREGMAELQVRDTGVGIPPAELERVFERFHRIAGQRARTHEGSGIGLALVHELVRLHGGTIAAASRPEGGTIITIRLPFGTAHLPPDRLGTARTPASTALRAELFVEEALRWLPADAPPPRPSEPAADGSEVLENGRQRVLLADDNADMRGYVRRLLSGSFAVEAVADGAAALAAARARPPDLVLADIMMPGLDGFGLLRALRADERLRELPVILLSARAGEEARVEGLEAGADDYLTKPFSARELVARVEAHLRLARLRREAAEAVRAREERLELLLHELSHRVKNTLTVIQSVASQTGIRSTTVPEFLDAFRGRLRALAAAHELLTAEQWRSAHLPTLAGAVLAPHLSGGRIELRLPDAALRPAIAQTLTLALHELATNALKHGALAGHAGRVALEGELTSTPGLVLLWREEGGPPIMAPPAERGFGMTLLTRAIAHQHRGEVELAWPPEGLTCRIMLPLEAD